MKGASFFQRLRYAWAGCVAAWRLEKSLRTHALATGCMLIMLLILQSPPWWWAIICLTVSLVVAAELINTAIEALADHLHPARHPAIQFTKDVAAAAVLVTSVGAAGVGVAFTVDQVWPWLQAALTR